MFCWLSDLNYHADYMGTHGSSKKEAITLGLSSLKQEKQTALGKIRVSTFTDYQFPLL